MIKILIDENLSESLAEGLNKLQIPNGDGIEVTSIIKEFYRGIKDEEWIPAWSKKDGIVITQDIRISKNKSQAQLLVESKLGVFFIKPPKNFRYWDKVKMIVNFWQDIVEVIKTSKRPFLCEITLRGGVKKLNV